MLLVSVFLQACQDAGQASTQNGATDTGGMPLTGMFRYMADAAVFHDCRNGKNYPVSMEGDYLALEKAYLRSGVEPGSEAMIEIRGRLLERPATEGNNKVIKLIPDSFKAIYANKSCAPEMNEPLVNTYWKLVEIDGRRVVTAENHREAHMILDGQSRTKGHGGCNNFSGGYTQTDDQLRFGAQAATMMACPEGMETEDAFFAALAATNRYAISGLFLSLYQDEALLARFEAVHF